jgi:hypothetical protein
MNGTGTGSKRNKREMKTTALDCEKKNLDLGRGRKKTWEFQNAFKIRQENMKSLQQFFVKQKIKINSRNHLETRRHEMGIPTNKKMFRRIRFGVQEVECLKHPSIEDRFAKEEFCHSAKDGRKKAIKKINQTRYEKKQ